MSTRVVLGKPSGGEFHSDRRKLVYASLWPFLEFKRRIFPSCAIERQIVR